MKYISSLVLVVALAGCAPQEDDIEMTPDFSEFVKGSALAWNDAWAAGDAVAIAGMYAEDAITLPPGGQPVVGRDAIQAQIQADLTTAPGGSITSLEAFSDGGLGVERGSWVAADSAGNELDRGNYLAVWMLVDGEWKVYRDTYNSSVPHMMTDEPEM